MGQDHRIDLGGLEGETLLLQAVYRVATLMHTTVEQHLAHRSRTQQVAGACYFLRCTEKPNTRHACLPPVFRYDCTTLAQFNDLCCRYALICVSFRKAA